MTPNGKYLMLYTQLRLDPAADQDSDTDIYRRDEADDWACIPVRNPASPRREVSISRKPI